MLACYQNVQIALDSGKFRNSPWTGPELAKNLKYEGASRNDGFVLMPNQVEAYRAGDKAFEYKGTNGFTTNIEMSSKDPK